MGRILLILAAIYVLGAAVWLAAGGIVLGAIAALGLTRLLQTFLFDVQSSDPGIYAGISLLICLVAFCACWIPARRASRIDPLVALRAE